jgi:hypothetical protein
MRLLTKKEIKAIWNKYKRQYPVLKEYTFYFKRINTCYVWDKTKVMVFGLKGYASECKEGYTEYACMKWFPNGSKDIERVANYLLLHEISHILTDKKYPSDKRAHGRHFQNTYKRLLVKHGFLERQRVDNKVFYREIL